MGGGVKIDLPLADSLRSRYVVREAEIVDVAPHLAHVATFAVHTRMDVPWVWRVSNIESGASVASADSKSKDETLFNAWSYLSKKTPEQVAAAIDAAIARQAHYTTEAN